MQCRETARTHPTPPPASSTLGMVPVPAPAHLYERVQPKASRTSHWQWHRSRKGKLKVLGRQTNRSARRKRSWSKWQPGGTGSKSRRSGLFMLWIPHFSWTVVSWWTSSPAVTTGSITFTWPGLEQSNQFSFIAPVAETHSLWSGGFASETGKEKKAEWRRRHFLL